MQEKGISLMIVDRTQLVNRLTTSQAVQEKRILWMIVDDRAVQEKRIPWMILDRTQWTNDQ